MRELRGMGALQSSFPCEALSAGVEGVWWR